MNKFKKYCPNVWVAECEEAFEKGEVIEVTTKYGSDIECEVYNLLEEKDGKFLYSIVRLDEGYASKKAEKYRNAAFNTTIKSNEKFQQSNECREFLSLGEPIKVGHHSEKRHRALYERNAKRMDKAMELQEKAEEQEARADYWEKRANTITLASPESIEYFEEQLKKAEEYHKKLKDNPELRPHTCSLTYAKKDVNELKKKIEIAKKLWGDNMIGQMNFLDEKVTEEENQEEARIEAIEATEEETTEEKQAKIIEFEPFNIKVEEEPQEVLYLRLEPSQQEIYRQLKEIDGITTEIVGKWLWCDGNTKENKDKLKELGLKFSGPRQKWYLRDSNTTKYRRPSKKTYKQIKDEYNKVIANDDDK